MQDSTFLELQSQFCLIFIVATTVFGATRLLLRSRFTSTDGKRFPTSIHISFFLIGTMMLTPYVAWPADEAVWNYVRAFNILYYPMGFIMGFEILNNHSTHVAKAAAITSLCVIAILLAMLLTGHERLLTDTWSAIATFTAVIGAVQTAVVFSFTRRLKKDIDRYNTASYSNQDDFYYKWTKIMIYYPAIWLIIMWAMFFTGNRWVMVASALPLIASNIIIMSKMMLRPDGLTMRRVTTTITSKDEHGKQREIDLEEDPNDNSQIENYDEVRDEVIKVIGRRYLEPNITRTEVLSDISYGKKTEAGRFITQIGFYDLVNMFRLRHAELYRQAFPNATQDAVAAASGFASRFALHRALKRNIIADQSLLKDFNPTIVM